MIKWFLKYGFVIYLLNTVLLSIEATFSIGYNIFLFLMTIFSLIILINPKQIKLIIFHKSFNFLLLLNLINLFYWLVFHDLSEYEAGKYLISKAMQFSIISFAIVHNYAYFKKEFMKHLVYTVLCVIFLGLIIDPFIFSGRYSGVIWNPNMLSSFTTMAFGSLFLMKKKNTNFEIAVLFIFLIISLATGSRDVLVAIAIAFIFKYGFSLRNIAYLFFAIFSYFIIINFQLNTSINRFESQSLFNDRLLQYKYAYETILQKPFFGFGLDKYAFINNEIIPYYLKGHILSSHNGYLAILTQYGLIFGLIVIGIIFYKVIHLFIKIDKKDPELLFYLYVACYIPIAAMYETFFTGINEFQTILFWFSLAFLSFTVFKKENGD
tara:strand:+ start:693 stop:1829 length:1137 start_codon:yes stop_codon:yes gene_type:complete